MTTRTFIWPSAITQNRTGTNTSNLRGQIGVCIWVGRVPALVNWWLYVSLRYRFFLWLISHDFLQEKSNEYQDQSKERNEKGGKNPTWLSPRNTEACYNLSPTLAKHCEDKNPKYHEGQQRDVAGNLAAHPPKNRATKGDINISTVTFFLCQLVIVVISITSKAMTKEYWAVPIKCVVLGPPLNFVCMDLQVLYQ
jgi:hypothetical protein